MVEERSRTERAVSLPKRTTVYSPAMELAFPGYGDSLEQFPIGTRDTRDLADKT